MTDRNTMSQHDNAARPSMAGARGTVGVIRAIAGSAIGWRRSRRGSFLVLVVGTLALLAVLAIIYSSIGNHDARLGAAVKRRAQVDDVPVQIGDYIARIIGDSVVSTYYDSRPGAGVVPLSRVTFDFPFTPWAASSDIAQPTTQYQFPFNPTGSVGGFMSVPDFSGLTGAQLPLTWAPSTPWLASTEPVFLNFGAAAVAPEEAYLYKRDWFHISNIAPDGRMVNLVNLRSALGINVLSGFGPNQMSDATKLGFGYDDAGVFGITTTDFGSPLSPANVRRPAYLDSRQRGLFRPARASGAFPPSDPRYEPNLFADADGDGMWDSRWQELVDARAAFLKNYLQTDGRYRYFVAAHIIDASALVNVNTATDLRAAPTAQSPIGLSPADIDLRRLLTMDDSFQISGIGYGPDSTAGAGGIYNNPAYPIADYELYDRKVSFNAGRFGYEALRLAAATTVIPPLVSDPTVPAPDSYRGLDLPDFAMNFTNLPVWDFTAAPQARATFYLNSAVASNDAHRAPSAGDIIFSGSFGMEDMAELLTRRAVNDPDVTSALEYTIGGRLRSPTATPDDARFSPLRSNRPLAVEGFRYTTINAADPTSDYGRTMQLFETDVRQRLTTISGARQLRTAPAFLSGATSEQSINPHELSASELRIDIRRALQQLSNPATTANVRMAAAQSIFQGYADSLLPTSGVGLPWGQDAAQFGMRRTEFYGYHPELALQAAAHMAMNMIDMYDVDSSPTVNTLLIDSSFAPTLNSSTETSLAWWTTLTPPANAKRPLELDAVRLPAAADNPTAPCLNIYGVEPQPFITQVGSFTVYADKERGDDNEVGGNPADIDGGDTTANRDFMYSVIAFQLHNPFPVPITLGGNPQGYDAAGAVVSFKEAQFYDIQDTQYPPMDREANYYYIKYGDRMFKLCSIEEPTYVSDTDATSLRSRNIPAIGSGDPAIAAGGIYIMDAQIPSGPAAYPVTASSIVIPAGGTVVCCSLSAPPREILQSRLAAVTSSPGDLTRAASWLLTDGTTAPDDWGVAVQRQEFRDRFYRAVKHYFGENNPDIAGVYFVPQLDPSTGQAALDRSPYPTSGANEDVLLWKAVRVGDDTNRVAVGTLPAKFWDGQTMPPARNNTLPTQMLTANDPSNDQLIDRFRADRSDIIPQLDAGDHPISSSTDSDDTSELFMVSTWATASRHGNPEDPVPLGALPAYCLEPKYSAGWNLPTADAYPAAGSLSLTDAPFRGGAKTLRSWYLNMYGAGGDLGNQIEKHPRELGSPIADTPEGPFIERYIEMCGNNAQFMQSPATAAPAHSVLRPSDLLLPLAIGPTEMPVDSTGVAITDLEQRWTTLGEALALALGYQPVPPGPDATLAYTLSPGGLPLDRGQLRLDQFSPFFDADNSGDFNRGDSRIGLQIPLALGVLDTFSVNEVFAAEPVTGTQPVQNSWESLKRATPGTLNINTTSLNTARAALSMLSPPPANDPFTQPWWWTQTQLDERVDIAATVIASRNKGQVFLRPASVVGAIEYVDFTETAVSIDELDDSQHAARSSVAQIGPGAALHEQPGFRSVGEMLTARVRDPADPLTNAYPFNMDFLGHDALPPQPGIAPPAGVTYNAGASGRIGFDSVLYGTSPAVPSNIVNSYKEQLTMINGVLNGVSVRSDYFICWFLVHGYQESDVRNLGPNDPLVPSIARRFVMVVDRSSVTHRGEKPKILLFKELPVDSIR